MNKTDCTTKETNVLKRPRENQPTLEIADSPEELMAPTTRPIDTGKTQTTEQTKTSELWKESEKSQGNKIEVDKLYGKSRDTNIVMRGLVFILMDRF